MGIKIQTIEARDLSDAWFQLVYNIIDNGRRFVIDKGSYAGQTRLEYDYCMGRIKFPGTRPLIPDIPAGCGIPNPVENDYIYGGDGYSRSYIEYLMTGEKEKGESYTYGSRMCEAPVLGEKLTWLKEVNKDIIDKFEVDGKCLFEKDGKLYINQIEWIIATYKKFGYNNNQMILQVGEPTDLLLIDPPCLRQIGCKIIENKLNFFVNFRSWDMWCLDTKTEILTKNGWKNIDTMSDVDEIASIDFSNSTMIFDKHNGINRSYYTGDMHSIKTKRIDQLITPNHSIIHKTVTHSGSKRKVLDWTKTEAKDFKIKDGSFIPLCRKYEGGNNSIGIEFAKLIGWVLTDGWISKKRDRVAIYQSSVKFTYVNEIKDILDKLKVSYRHDEKVKYYSDSIIETIRKKEGSYTFHTFDIHSEFSKIIKNIIPNKKPTRFLLSLNLEERLAIYEAMIKGDGTIKHGRNGTISHCFYQKDINTLEWFMELCISIGKHPILNRKKSCVQVSNKINSMIQPIHFKNRKFNKIKYNGFVWCVSTNLGNIIIKRNDKISVTGNSGTPANLAGIQNLKEYMAGEIGVEDGEMIVESKGLHLYGYAEDLASLRCFKDIK